MNMNPGLDECVCYRSWSGPGDKAFRRNADPKSFMNYGYKLKKIGITQFFRSLIVQVYEKLEPFRLLLDNVQFRS